MRKLVVASIALTAAAALVVMGLPALAAGLRSSGRPWTVARQGHPQPGSARRRRSASARSFTAISSARVACSLASAACGPP
jgi:hypothetical protein